MPRFHRYRRQSMHGPDKAHCTFYRRSYGNFHIEIDRQRLVPRLQVVELLLQYGQLLFVIECIVARDVELKELLVFSVAPHCIGDLRVRLDLAAHVGIRQRLRRRIRLVGTSSKPSPS